MTEHVNELVPYLIAVAIFLMGVYVGMAYIENNTDEWRQSAFNCLEVVILQNETIAEKERMIEIQKEIRNMCSDALHFCRLNLYEHNTEANTNEQN